MKNWKTRRLWLTDYLPYWSCSLLETRPKISDQDRHWSETGLVIRPRSQTTTLLSTQPYLCLAASFYSNIKICHLLDFLPSCSFDLHPWTPMEDFRHPNPRYAEPYHFSNHVSIYVTGTINCSLCVVLIDFQCVTSVAVWIRTFHHRC